MSLQQKFDSALALVNEHNTVIGGAEQPGYVNPENFINCIKASGGTTEDRLKGFSYEDILSCLPNVPGAYGTNIKPVALAKDIAKIFRGKEDATSDSRPVSSRKAEKMTVRELVEAYDPEDSDNAVGKRLKEMSKGQAFIVFTTGNTVDVDTTFKLLDEIRKGFPGRKDVDVGGNIRETHVVGSRPENYVDENPLYRGRPLRPDGTCDQTGRSWDGIDMKLRQLIRVAMNTRELEDVTIEKANDILDVCVGEDPWKKLRTRYRKAAVEFDKLEKVGNLPRLSLVLNMQGGGPGGNPFAQPKKVQFKTDASFNAGFQAGFNAAQNQTYSTNRSKWWSNRE